MAERSDHEARRPRQQDAAERIAGVGPIGLGVGTLALNDGPQARRELQRRNERSRSDSASRDTRQPGLARDHGPP